jgi:hypothetical protein
MSFTVQEKIKTIIKLLFEPKVITQLISFRSFGYLLQTGWINSFKKGMPLDKDHNPIPWFTYSAIEFLSERLNKTMKVFEFGSGNSTLFFASRVSSVESVEHDRNWYEKMSKQSPSNSKIIYASADQLESYLNPLKTNNQKFDIIIVDGIYRNECLSNSIRYLSEKGVIILDDSERDDYAEGIKYLLNNGFKQINFSGIAPSIFFRKCTTVFYRSGNCLDI